MVVGWGDPLCVEVSVVMESLSMGGSELSESDSELESSEELDGGTESLEELGGGTVFRRGRPRERGVVTMYSNGRRRWKMC